ncbi:uncharacterized protein LOC128244446 [Mya arenaria]|uniref:uncharacterized protein LOC128244446 n=1 Tax=Mya arenaria TaxID=6604 RepID=UPI0022E60028|nr:uncharacterized protein LOC128244446 [Mya arenaria]
MEPAMFNKVFLVLLTTVECYAFLPDPLNLWPLSNVSLFSDVIGENDIIHDGNQVCFTFIEGPAELPYSVIDIEEQLEPFLDANIKGTSPLRDLTVSFFVYPDNDEADIKGTLIHYQAEEREVMRIRMLANTFLVSFRDEYGMSAGMMYLVNFLTPHAWNLVTVTREYASGKIIVYKNGVELYNADDEFSDVISFPSTGRLRLGKSQDPDDEDVFEGSFACVQLYEHRVPDSPQRSVAERCHPDHWNRQFHHFYQDSNGLKCLSDPPSNKAMNTSVVSMTTVTKGSAWEAFLNQFDLNDSGNEVGYLKLRTRDQKPSTEDDLIGQYNVTNFKICSRLCVRVNGCRAALVDGAGTQCKLYDDDEPALFVDDAGSKYYIIVD